MTHIERDSDCNGNEKGNSKKQMGGRPKIKNNMQNRERERETDRQTENVSKQMICTLLYFDSLTL